MFRFIKAFSICTHFWEKYIYKGLIFLIIFVTSEIFKSFFTKRYLIRYYYFINICIFYWNRSFMPVKFLFLDFNITRFYDCFFQFYLGFQKKIRFFLICNFLLSYNVLLFSVKSAFFIKFIASFLLIKLIIQR